MLFDTTHVFHFGRVPAEADPSECFEENGQLYYFRVVYDGEQIVIYDTCNRAMPINKEDLPELGLTVFALKGIVKAEQLAEDVYWKNVREVAAVAEHFANDQG